MLKWFRRVFLYLFLSLFGRGGHCDVVKELTRNSRRRKNRKHVDGITEELDEFLELPVNYLQDTKFFGFSKDGSVVLFQNVREQNIQEHTCVSLELPGKGRFTANDSRPIKLGHGPLHLKTLEPMRRWKISFHGTMDCHIGGTDTEPLHVSVSLYWQCVADPFDHWSCPSAWQLAGNMSNQPLSATLMKQLLNIERVSYEQWGEMWGRVDIEGFESQAVRLKGYRARTFARIGTPLNESTVSHHLIQDDGEMFITNGCLSRSAKCEKQPFGYFMFPVGERLSTDQSDLEVEIPGKNSSIRYPLHLNVRKRSLTIDKMAAKAVPMTMRSGPATTSLTFTTFTINDKHAYGIQCQETLQLLSSPKADNSQQGLDAVPLGNIKVLTTPFNSEQCRQTTVVGGKGANLSVLDKFDFPVPRGLCVTTHAHKAQIESCTDLQLAYEEIENAIGNREVTGLSRICDHAVRFFIDTPISPSVAVSIEEGLIRSFGQEFGNLTFAVRSSGVSEDGKEASFAGQLESFLNVTGLKNICHAVCKCWASAVSYRAVEYRRQNGQPVIEPIAVVIQEMVDSEVAGVLFTNDPVTGNSRVMVINAAPGLGENVVSGTCSPDTIRVRRNQDSEGLQVLSADHGSVLNELGSANEDAGCNANGNQSRSGELCITRSQIHEVCSLGLRAEELFGCPQDIEWAIFRERLYILQARPITSLNEETEEELIHEFDTPLALDYECLTTCNIGEELPGAATTLTTDVYGRACSECAAETVMANSCTQLSDYAQKGVAISANKMFLNMTALAIQADGFLMDKESFDIFLCGQVFDEHTTEMIETYKGGRISTLNSMKAGIKGNLILMPRNVKWFAKWTQQVDSFTIGNDTTTAFQLYSAIDENLQIYFHVWAAYMYKIAECGFPIGILFKLLQGSDKNPSHDNHADIATLLAKCQILTADVPTALQELAITIVECDLKDTFLALQDARCHDLLVNSDQAVGKKYSTFLSRHGYRCTKESEFVSKSWASDPTPTIRAIKALLRAPLDRSRPDEEMTNPDIMADLKTPLSWFTKYFIQKYLLAKARAGVAAREVGKAVAVKTTSIVRDAYWRLADLMVREGRLPDDDMLFFLTHTEIGNLIDCRSPALVRKARRRMQVFKKQDSLRYEKIIFGRPEALVETSRSLDDDASASCTVVSGMSIGKGVATGRACVVTSLEEADIIEPGDILICPLTDIGWSPYFPMIAGLVTEIGGLISHGAVVAREVGIPCIVNAPNATRLFKTGDRVRIDGLGGVLKKLND